MMRAIRQFLRNEEAAAATEYAILISLILLVVFSAVTTLGSKTNSAFNNAATKL